MTYYNEEDEKKLIIHSLDKEPDGKERIIFYYRRKGNELKAKYQTYHLRRQINNYEKHKNTFRNSGGIFTITWDLQVINFCYF